MNRAFHRTVFLLKEVSNMIKQLKNKRNNTTSIVFVMLLFALIFGCAGTRKMSPIQMDELLVRAGFELRTADTPNKLNFIKSLPLKKVVAKKQNEKLHYLYVVDTSSCKCMYVGDGQDYQRLHQMIKEHQMEEKMATTRYSDPVMLEDEALDPDSTWGEPLR
jgi:hypothetical protein